MAVNSSIARSTLAGQGHSSCTLLSSVPSPSMQRTLSPAHTHIHRPSKTELDTKLAHAQVRAQARKLRAALGIGHPSNVRPRISRATAALPTSFTAASSPLSTLALPSPVTPFPAFHQLPSGVGLGISLSLSPRIAPTIYDPADSIVSPRHVYPSTFRRTPGAPLMERKHSSAAGRCYFHLPPNSSTPVGLGISNVNLGPTDASLSEYFVKGG